MKASAGYDPDTVTVPIIFEAYGAAGKNAQKLIRRIVHLWDDYTHGAIDPQARAAFEARWTQKLSMALQQGNAKLAMAIAWENKRAPLTSARKQRLAQEWALARAEE